MQGEHQDDVLDVFKKLELMWMSIVLHKGADADEAYDSLFGPEDWVGRLTAVGKRTAEFQSRFPGPVVKIDNFAVTSGHEAVAMFARRVAEYAPARAKWINTHRTERESARAAGNETQARRAERDLREAIRDFAQFMERPFNGWFEHRAWIRRSIEQEIANPDSDKRGRETPDGEMPDSPNPAEWRSSAHQRLVINILQRDGKLQTRVLWDRISPKYVDRRAHQNSMRDLIENKKVRRTGKGRATEYELL